MHRAPTEFAGSLTDLFDHELAAVLPTVKCVNQFDLWMKQYCAEPDPVFVVRGVRGTARCNQYTTRDGTRFVAADNSPAWTVHAVLMGQRLQTYADFRALIAQMPTHMFDVKKQVRETANNFGWYVAHIARAKDGNTDYEAWDRPEVERRFYRTIHPCNLFFVPGVRNCHLGENLSVICFIASRYAARYGQAWTRFCQAAGFAPEAGDPDFGSTIMTIDSRPPADQDPAHGAGLLTIDRPAIRYAASRPKFKRDPIEALNWDEVFEVATPMGTYRFTKKQFYTEFPTIPQSRSYKDACAYHGKALHLKAQKFKLPES